MTQQWNGWTNQAVAVRLSLKMYGDDILLQIALDFACGSEQEQNSPCGTVLWFNAAFFWDIGVVGSAA